MAQSRTRRVGGSRRIRLFGVSGLLRLPGARRTPFEWWKFLLDALLTGLGGGAVIWYVVIRPLTVVELPSLHRAILLAFPFAALVFFVGLLMTLLRRPAEVSPGAAASRNVHAA